MSNATDQAFPSPGMPYINPEIRIPHDPFDGYGWMVEPQSGLTKREIFAAMAMQGILANGIYDAPRRKKLPGMAEDAVSAADALIAELDKVQS